jgi:hypothetical protein
LPWLLLVLLLPAAGSLSMDGLLVLRVTASSEDSTPARMARMAAQAQVGTREPRLREGEGRG